MCWSQLAPMNLLQGTAEPISKAAGVCVKKHLKTAKGKREWGTALWMPKPEWPVGKPAQKRVLLIATVTCEKPTQEQASSEWLKPLERAHTEAGEKHEGVGAAEGSCGALTMAPFPCTACWGVCVRGGVRSGWGWAGKRRGEFGGGGLQCFNLAKSD